MKNAIKWIKELKEKQNGKAILFFGFYFFFFVFIFLLIQILGNKNALFQEYEKGVQNNTFDNQGVLLENFYYDYKVVLDGVVHDYYGKKLLKEENFKYNSQDYYMNQGNYYLMNDSLEPCENPFLFREFMEIETMGEILDSAYYVSKTEYENGSSEYHYLISTNTLNSILHNDETDYDDVPDNIVIKLDSNGEVQSVLFDLNQYCKYQGSCQNSLKIELSYELFGEVSQIRKE